MAGVTCCCSWWCGPVSDLCLIADNMAVIGAPGFSSVFYYDVQMVEEMVDIGG